MMRIPSGVTDQVIYFIAVDETDLATRETGLSSFTVYRDRNGGGAAAMTTPTVTEVDSTNMPGVYKLLLDEDMTIGAGNDSEEMCFHITHAGMAPVTRTIELYRPIDSVVWDAQLADHAGSDTFGERVGGVLDSPANIATAVWNKTRASASTAGTFGEGVASVQGVITGDLQGGVDGDINGNIIGNVEGTVLSLHTTVLAAVADAVWEETLSDHTAVEDSVAEKIDAIPAGSAVSALVWGASRATYTAAGTFGQGVASVQGNVTGSIGGNLLGNIDGDINGEISGVISGNFEGSFGASALEAIADSVWDELTAGHTTPNSFAVRDADTLTAVNNVGTVATTTFNLLNTGGAVRLLIEDVPTTAEFNARTLAAASYATAASITALNDLNAAETAAAVWGADLSTYSSIGDSTAERLDAIPTSSVIASNVWNSLRVNHQIIGSFGQGVASVQGDVTGSIGGNLLGNIDGDINGEISGVISGNFEGSFGASAYAQLGDAPWNESQAGHAGVGTFGEALIAASSDAGTTASQTSAASIRTALGLATANLDTQLGDLPTVSEFNARTLTSASYATAASITALNDLNAAETAAAVWNAITASYEAAGTFGEMVALTAADTNELQGDWTDGGRLDAILDTIDGIVDAILVDTGTTLPSQISAASAPTADAIAEAVWDESLGDHSLPGSVGEALTEIASATGTVLIDAINDLDTLVQALPSAADNADAVWEEPSADHLTAGRTGALLASINSTSADTYDYLSATLAPQISAILVDTAELQTDWADSGRLDQLLDGVVTVTGALGATAAARMKLSAERMLPLTVDAAALTPTTTQFETNATEATADHYKGRTLAFTSGNLTDHFTQITGYSFVGGRGRFTVAAMPEAPANGDTFLII